MTDVEKSEILHIWHVCDVENVAIYEKFNWILINSELFLWLKSIILLDVVTDSHDDEI